MGLMEYLLVNYRWIFVCFFLLPASVVYDAIYNLRNRLILLLKSAPGSHRTKVKHVQQQVREWDSRGRKRYMCTSRPGWSTMSFRRGKYKEVHEKIDVNLMDVIDVDTVNCKVVVEPMVTIGQLTATLIPLGWTLPIVPELEDLTIGGLIMGCGIETSSHKAGLFQHTCSEFEIVTSDGTVKRCSKKENQELFYAIPWSHGTLGLLTSAEIKIIPAKSYVKLHYIPTYSAQETFSAFTKYSIDREYDFVEAIVYRPEEAVLLVGILTDECVSSKINEVHRYDKPWFYKYVEKFLVYGPDVEYIPLRDYYRRHSRSIFWQLEYIIPFGNSRFFRKFFGWMAPPKVSFLKLTQTEGIKKLYEENQMIQDVLVPISHLGKTLEFFDKAVKMYPLWLCPFNLPAQQGLVHPAADQDEMYVDVGAYGQPKVKNYRPKETTRMVEKFVRDIHGFQMLYADTYMTRDEFRQMFDHSLYDKLRKIEKCEDAFPVIYDKISKAART